MCFIFLSTINFQNNEKYKNIKTVKSLIKKFPIFNTFFHYKIYELFRFFVEQSEKDKLINEFGIKNAKPLYELVRKEKKFRKKEKNTLTFY